MAMRCRYDHHSFLRGKSKFMVIKLPKPTETYQDIANNIFMVTKNLRFKLFKLQIKEVFILGLRSFF